MTKTDIKNKILQHKDNVHRKLKYQRELEASKREAAKDWREQINAVKEQLTDELEEIERLENQLVQQRLDEVVGNTPKPPVHLPVVN